MQGFCWIFASSLAPIIPQIGLYGLKYKAFSFIQCALPIYLQFTRKCYNFLLFADTARHHSWPRLSPKMVPLRRLVALIVIARVRFNVQLVMAVLLCVAGLTLVFCGFWVAPSGEIDNSVLVAFGEICTFAGALFGVDYSYNLKIKD